VGRVLCIDQSTTIINDMGDKVNLFTLKFINSCPLCIDLPASVVYNCSMMTTNQTQITRDNVKMVAVPEALHTEIKVLSARDRLPMYAVVASAIRLYKALHQDTPQAAIVTPQEKRP
jgi:hypothetical protein